MLDELSFGSQKVFDGLEHAVLGGFLEPTNIIGDQMAVGNGHGVGSRHGTTELEKKKRKEKGWDGLPVFTGGTLEEDNASLIRTLCEGMCGAVPAVVCGTGKCQLELRFGVCGDV